MKMYFQGAACDVDMSQRKIMEAAGWSVEEPAPAFVVLSDDEIKVLSKKERDSYLSELALSQKGVR